MPFQSYCNVVDYNIDAKYLVQYRTSDHTISTV